MSCVLRTVRLREKFGRGLRSGERSLHPRETGDQASMRSTGEADRSRSSYALD